MRLVKPYKQSTYYTVVTDDDRELGIVVWHTIRNRWVFRPVYGAAPNIEEIGDILTLMTELEDNNVDQTNPQ